MSKKIEESPITNESEFFVALQIRDHLIKDLIHQCTLCVIASILVLIILLHIYVDYFEYYIVEGGVTGVLGGILVVSIIDSLPVYFVIRMFIKKHNPFEEEIERYVNENPAILDRSSGALSEQELSFLSSLKREDGANLQTMEKRVRCRE